MIRKIERNYLEIKSLSELRESHSPTNDYFIKLINPADFQLNKFFYKKVGKKHNWIDRLEWSDKKWIEYVSNKNVKKNIVFKKIEALKYLKKQKKYDLILIKQTVHFFTKTKLNHLLKLAKKN